VGERGRARTGGRERARGRERVGEGDPEQSKQPGEVREELRKGVRFS
jgi:hypothetical protein